jgi:hypothetical protein
VSLFLSVEKIYRQWTGKDKRRCLRRQCAPTLCPEGGYLNFMFVVKLRVCGCGSQ